MKNMTVEGRSSLFLSLFTDPDIFCWFFFFFFGLGVERELVKKQFIALVKEKHLHHHHQSLSREGRWDSIDDFANSFLHFSCSPLPSGTCRTPGLSISTCCLPTSSFVRLVFFPLSPCLARWFWPDLMNGKHDHTTAVCVSLRSSGDLHVVQLPAGSWHGLPRW